MFKFLYKIDQIIKKIEEIFLAMSMIIISFLIMYNVILRYVFSRGWPASNEISIILVVISTFVGSSYAARKGSHLSMSAIYDVTFISLKTKKIFIVISSFLIATMSFILAYYGFRYVQSNIISSRSTHVLNIPRYYINIFFPLGFTFMGIHYIKNIFINFKKDELYEGPEQEKGGF